MRKIKYKKRTLKPDLRYNSLLVAQLINYVMRQGKKTLAQKMTYNALSEIEKKTKKNSLEILQQAVKNVSPLMEVKSKRIGGATYQVPIEVRHDRRVALALRWIIEAAREKKGSTFDKKLSQEILNSYNNTGFAITKKENTHKAARANKAFAHFARF